MTARRAVGQPALRAAQRADLRGPRRGPAHRIDGVERLRTSPPTRSRPRRPAPAPSSTCRSARTVRRVLERRPGDRRACRWRSARTRRSCSARSCGARPGSRCSSRPPTPAGGAQGPGRAAAGVVRRALDHLDLRPVRGERPLLPGAAADLRRRGPGRGAGARRHPAAGELRLHNGTVYRWNRPVYDVVDGRPHLRVENRVLPAGPTVVDTLANAAFYYGLVRRWPRPSGRCGRRCRSAPPRRTSTPAPGTASTRVGVLAGLG
jgi:hypothetical protein